MSCCYDSTVMKVPLSLSIGYLNVDGLHRKWSGCKIPHIKELHEITIISETWSYNHSKDIENYSYFQVESYCITNHI